MAKILTSLLAFTYLHILIFPALCSSAEVDLSIEPRVKGSSVLSTHRPAETQSKSVLSTTRNPKRFLCCWPGVRSARFEEPVVPETPRRGRLAVHLNPAYQQGTAVSISPYRETSLKTFIDIEALYKQYSTVTVAENRVEPLVERLLMTLKKAIQETVRNALRVHKSFDEVRTVRLESYMRFFLDETGHHFSAFEGRLRDNLRACLYTSLKKYLATQSNVFLETSLAWLGTNRAADPGLSERATRLKESAAVWQSVAEQASERQQAELQESMYPFILQLENGLHDGLSVLSQDIPSILDKMTTATELWKDIIVRDITVYTNNPIETGLLVFPEAIFSASAEEEKLRQEFGPDMVVTAEWEQPEN